jgi:hypothetical protein
MRRDRFRILQITPYYVCVERLDMTSSRASYLEYKSPSPRPSWMSNLEHLAS